MQATNPATNLPLRTLLRSLSDGKENAQSAAAVTLEKAFSSLERGDTDKCARAAELFAGAATNGLVDEYALPVLLSCIPEGVERGALYVNLAEAMRTGHVDAKSWHFQFLLDAACDDEHLCSDHALAILNTCSEHFAAHHVTYVDAWDKLHALLAKIEAEPQVEALCTLVRAAHAAGIEGAARWVEVVEKAMKAMPSAEEAEALDGDQGRSVRRRTCARDRPIARRRQAVGRRRAAPARTAREAPSGLVCLRGVLRADPAAWQACAWAGRNAAAGLRSARPAGPDSSAEPIEGPRMVQAACHRRPGDFECTFSKRWQRSFQTRSGWIKPRPMRQTTASGRRPISSSLTVCSASRFAAWMPGLPLRISENWSQQWHASRSISYSGVLFAEFYRGYQLCCTE